MSRLGDLIRTERIRRNMTTKQVAKKCGVAESYLQAVEAGTRIIQDEQARRILRTIGLTEHHEADFTLDDIASTVDLSAAVPNVQERIAPVARKEPEQETVAASACESSSIWLDALSSVMKRVPIYNGVMKEVGHRLLPVTDGKIEDAKAEKVFYFRAPDDSMRGFRICRDDDVFVVPSQSPIDDAIMVVELDGHRMIRKIKKLDAVHLLLQSFDSQYKADSVLLCDVMIVGRCTRVEITL